MDKSIERALALLKMSGVQNVFLSSTPDIDTADRDSVFIIDHSTYINFPERLNNLQSSAAIIYRNTSFKSVFLSRICRNNPHFELFIHLFFSY